MKWLDGLALAKFRPNKAKQIHQSKRNTLGLFVINGFSRACRELWTRNVAIGFLHGHKICFSLIPYPKFTKAKSGSLISIFVTLADKLFTQIFDVK